MLLDRPTDLAVKCGVYRERFNPTKQRFRKLLRNGISAWSMKTLIGCVD